MAPTRGGVGPKKNSALTLPVRAATKECDEAEKCTGSASTCPKDGNKPDGAACSKGLCKAGVCISEGCSYGAARAPAGAALVLLALLGLVLVRRRVS